MSNFYKNIINFLPLSAMRFSERSSLSVLQRLHRSNDHVKKHFSSSSARLKDDKIPSTLTKYELFSEETAPVILDVVEERERGEVQSEKKPLHDFAGINLEGAATGIFDVHEIVELLKREKGEEIFVIKIPPEYNYADHMVLVTGRSQKHMLAIVHFIRKIYKLKVEGRGHIPKLEGKHSNIWMALDLGNIILHVFSKTGRELYDLETLWCVGKNFDSLSRSKMHDSILTNYAKILASLSPNT